MGAHLKDQRKTVCLVEVRLGAYELFGPHFTDDIRATTPASALAHQCQSGCSSTGTPHLLAPLKCRAGLLSRTQNLSTLMKTKEGTVVTSCLIVAWSTSSASTWRSEELLSCSLPQMASSVH
eukprot:scaffold97774_cov19-Tisochrysis_lutea.AAC.2